MTPNNQKKGKANTKALELDPLVEVPPAKLVYENINTTRVIEQ
jgi:hypothetical protein